MPDQQSSKGRLVVIVGPSGSGKDTLINWLRDRLSGDDQYLFVKRTVTRKTDSALEDHASLSEDEFETAKCAGKFAVTWTAHGLQYGIPVVVTAHVQDGGIAIANGSRRALTSLQAVFPTMLVINLHVDRDVLAKRLAQRGRETAEEIKRRLARMDVPIPDGIDAIPVDNSGPADRAGKAILDIINSVDESPDDVAMHRAHG